MSRAYTGIDGADNTIPGIVVIRRDGTIAFRQISTEKDDRLDSAQLLAIVDRTLGTSGTSASAGYAAIDRMQLGLETGGAFAEDTNAVGVSARFVFPLTRIGFVGVRAGYSTSSTVDSSLVAGLRLPLLNDTAAIQVTAIGGLAKTTPYGGGQLGLWLAWTPTWSVHLDAGVTTVPALTVTLGVSRLISWH